MKVTTRKNWRVVVYPKISRWIDEELHEANCRDILSQIKDHINDIGYTEIVSDTIETCSHCRHDWDVSKDDLDKDYPIGCPALSWSGTQTLASGLSRHAEATTPTNPRRRGFL